MTSDVEAVVAHARAVLGAPEHWVEPAGYVSSLALSMLDSAFSLQATYKSAERVIARYREHRRAAGADPNNDGTPELRATIDEVGGPAAAATSLFVNRTVAPGTARGGLGRVLKSEAVYEAAVAFETAGIHTVADLHARVGEGGSAWLRTRGLGIVSWDYLLMNTGVDGVKPDTMVQRFVGHAIGASGPADLDRARAAVKDAAAEFHVSQRRLDHAVWLYQRRQRAEA
ncbi:hypothetical protein [Cellulomonas fimi]|uniref:hypothetical protein n=1 Tax=Cellulomonas fimi TaxID=1708 RepID=UPI00235A0E30|nr:hypothetical protein [Cellulomonas fimi]